MLKRRPIDLHINHERWLISYADFVTLLFAFFVVMYSVSQLNESKYKELSSSLNGFFTETQQTNVEISNERNESNEDTQISSASLIELPALEDAFYQQLLPLIEQGAIEVSSNELWLQISLNNRILFGVGSVKPSSQANGVIAKIATIMKDTVNPVRVEGFTDNLTINTAQFPSNWQLSAARASAIVELLAVNGVSPKQLSAVGYGEFQPIADNSSEAGRAKNRRVALMIGKFQESRPTLNSSEINSVTSNKQVDNRVEVSAGQGSVKTASNVEEGQGLISSINEVTPNEILLKQTSPESIKPIILESGDLLFTNDPGS
ncbi:MAG: chemotaxis protein MotB [Candidatus Endobugula sp.]|jgi:chemotaxis protein MotB